MCLLQRITHCRHVHTCKHPFKHTNMLPGTPALTDPLKDYSQHQDMDYNSALDCGLEGTIDLAYLDARPPSKGAQCPDNPAANNTAYMQFLQDNAARKTSIKTHLGQCKVRNSGCSEFCITGGVATSTCNAVDFDMFLVFNGAEIGMARTLHDKVSDMQWISLWQAESGGVYVQRHHQPLESGPIPEGMWRVGTTATKSSSGGVSTALEEGAVGLLPCCGTNVYERTACEAYDPACVLRFWLYNNKAATWTDRQGIQVSDREGIYVLEESFMSVLSGVQGNVLLIVDYSAKLRTDDIKVTSNRWRAYVMGLWDYGGSVVGEKLCLDAKLSLTKDFTKQSDFTEGLFENMEKELKDSGHCDTGPKKGKICYEDSDCEESASEDTVPGSISAVFFTAEPKCVEGSSWMKSVQEALSSATTGESSENQDHESSTGELNGRVCFLECWIGVPMFRLAVNIECGMTFEFTMIGKACFYPEPGAMIKVDMYGHLCVYVHTHVHIHMYMFVRRLSTPMIKLDVCEYLCVCIFIYTGICICTYTT
jgi:hypothetical protein